MRVVHGVAAFGLLTGSVGMAQAPEDMETLTERVRKLERIVAELQSKADAQAEIIVAQREQLDRLAPSESVASEPVETPQQTASEKLAFSGLVEVEAGYSQIDSDAGDGHESDIAQGTFELGLEVDITDWIRVRSVLLWEEDDTEPIDLDTAAVHLGNPDRSPYWLTAGRLYVPFGNFESHFITDALTLELGETRETAVVAGWTAGDLDLSATVYNGDVAETGEADDTVDSIVLSGTFSREWDGSSLALGLAYTNNLADSDGLQDAVAANASGGTLDDRIGGFSGWAGFNLDNVTVLAEYVAALDTFAPNSLSFDGPGNDWTRESQPASLNLEAVCEIADRFAVAARYEHGDDTFDWLPQQRGGVCASILLHDGRAASASLALEYLHAVYDDADDTTEDTLTLQLSTSF
ncbi:MAG: LbtU family siderophore porin [Verrucomicrobiota bacterium]